MDGWVCMGVWYEGGGGCLEGGELMGLYECGM